MAASYLTQQDGTSHILLQDASGALITAADQGTPDPCSILTEDNDFLTTETGEDLILEECGAATADLGPNKLFGPPRHKPRQHRQPSEHRELFPRAARVTARALPAKLVVQLPVPAAHIDAHTPQPTLAAALAAVPARNTYTRQHPQPLSRQHSDDIDTIVIALATDRAGQPRKAAKHTPEA